MRLKLRVFPFAISLAISTLFFSCQKDDPSVIQQQAQQSAPDFKMMSVAYYTQSTDGSSLQVRFYESQRIYSLSTTVQNFDNLRSLLDQSKNNKIPVRVESPDEVAPFAPILNVQAASDQEIADFSARFASDGDDSRSIYATVIPISELGGIFNFMKHQNCALGTSTLDYCIPFQYVVDGCYARAHKMKQILEMNYGYTCRKVFSFEGPDGYLAVDAGDCCVYWWYHVAPLVRVQLHSGEIVDRVLDPSMFDAPVSIDTWTGAQENLACSPDADWGYYDIEPGFWYGPDGSRDNHYVYTNWTLQAYSDLVTCP